MGLRLAFALARFAAGCCTHRPPRSHTWVKPMPAAMTGARTAEADCDGRDTPAPGRDRARDLRYDPVRPARAHRRGLGRGPRVLRRNGWRRGWLADPDLGPGVPAGTGARGRLRRARPG